MTNFTKGQIKEKRIKTKEELIDALGANSVRIVIEGELAEKLGKTKKMEGVGTTVLSALAAAIPKNNCSKRTSFFRIIDLSISTGLGVGVVNAIVSIGIATVIEIYRDYDIEYEFISAIKQARLTKR